MTKPQNQKPLTLKDLPKRGGRYVRGADGILRTAGDAAQIAALDPTPRPHARPAGKTPAKKPAKKE